MTEDTTQTVEAEQQEAAGPQVDGGAAADTQAGPAAVWEPYPPEGDPGPHTVVGTMKWLRGLESPQLGNRRDILVYLPPSYNRSQRRYPVIYMHDGQNLFDKATSFGEEWEVDQTLEAASEEGLEAIVVGIPNMGKDRLNEYSPWHDRRHKQGGRGEAYLQFIIHTLKPIIDRDFRTMPGRESTGSRRSLREYEGGRYTRISRSLSSWGLCSFSSSLTVPTTVCPSPSAG